MKLIYKIARAELRNLFYSPVAWFLGIAFLVQCAYFYTDAIGGLAKTQESLIKNSKGFEGFGMSLTRVVFLNNDGIFTNVMNNLYLFLPLLTMGVISREINNGTIRLLNSSPIKTRHIVLGKYFAIMLYNLLLLGIVGIFMVAGLVSISHVDTGLVLSALLGFYLLTCAFSAIGIYMSSLTNYQIVSAIATFLVFFVLTRISSLWQQYDFVRDLTYFLSMNGRTNKMVAGLITTRDVIYFLLIIGMFLSFTLFRVKGSMESIPWYKKAGRYMIVIIVVLGLGYISSLPAFIGYWDTTRNNVNTIHPNTQNVIEGFEKGEPLEVVLYSNILHRQSYNRGGKVEKRNEYKWDLWERYLRFKPDIKFSYVNYYDIQDGDSSIFKYYPNKTLEEIAMLVADGLDANLSKFKKPREIRKEIDLKPENLRMVMQLKYKGRTTFLRTFDDLQFWPDEMQVSAAFKRLQQAAIPKVLFTSGNLERNVYKTGEREYNKYSMNISTRKALVNLGFDVDSINPDTQDIPADIAVLVVADPKTTLSAAKQQKIEQYIAKGGNAYFLGEPGKQPMLNPLLANLGVQLSNGTLVEITKNEMPHMLRPFMTKEAAVLSDQFYHDRQSQAEKKVRERPFHLMPGAAEVAVMDSVKDFKRLTILATDRRRKAFNKMGILVTDSVPPLFNPMEGDIYKPSFATLVGLSRTVNNKEQRVVVSGDADYMSNLRSGGGNLSLAVYSWLADNRFPVYTPEAIPIDTRLNISDAASKWQKIFFVWVLPAFLILLGTVMLIRRKRK
jgi:ABC-2 type transport system permease protein